MSKITIDTEDPEIRAILGLMCFTTAPIAHTLRDGGQKIPPKVEAEQTAAFIWLIGVYQEHGSEWRARADELLRRIANDAAANDNPHKITARDGLLWREGKSFPLPDADDIARRFGFQHAEQFVRYLAKE